MPNAPLSTQTLHALLSQRLDNQDFCMRIFHGRGKHYPGYERINIEWYPPYIFVQNFGDNLPIELNEALSTLFASHENITAVLVQSRQQPDFKTEILLSRTPVELPLIFDALLAEGLTCEVKLGANRNTGVFLDMRSGWHWVKEFSEGKRVLNLFSYTGVFSLFALSGGAIMAHNVDMAANVLKVGQRNHQINKLHDGLTAFYKRDILKSQRWFEGREPYDLIILDPPPYQKKAFRGWADYLKLLDYARVALADNGTLLCCFNNPQVSIDEYENDLREHFGDVKSLEVIERAQEIEELNAAHGLKLIALSP